MATRTCSDEGFLTPTGNALHPFAAPPTFAAMPLKVLRSERSLCSNGTTAQNPIAEPWPLSRLKVPEETKPIRLPRCDNESLPFVVALYASAPSSGCASSSALQLDLAQQCDLRRRVRATLALEVEDYPNQRPRKCVSDARRQAGYVVQLRVADGIERRRRGCATYCTVAAVTSRLGGGPSHCQQPPHHGSSKHARRCVGRGC
eukprot:scaffold73160_cov30-Tisochrysis_lutea.AAC.3